jgi:excisionase family DNA binding protein
VGALSEEFSMGRAAVSAEPPDVLTPKQLAELLQVDLETVTAMAAAAEIPGRQLKGEWRFSRSAVLTWLGSASAASPAA